ncbi:auxin-induced protein 22D-like isoform X1 [Ananas comosus]|uniref:Auxin-responsive protein n=2 Tax=Ananas comosus TaxID=4615 RepID=A0A6P5GHI4_ANACO|nr:auxin-induced protein 22D-like isoform X1 [Ananas comosus]
MTKNMEKEAALRFGDGENFAATELRLGLPGTRERETATKVLPTGSKEGGTKRTATEIESNDFDREAKTQVVGWPPIRSYRRNTFRSMKRDEEKAGTYVKVSMDGAPILRKIDLEAYKGYKELREALEDMFKCFPSGESVRVDAREYAVTYEDKDGDLMLVGDVPWEMFITSCKRLRILRGLAPST